MTKRISKYLVVIFIILFQIATGANDMKNTKKTTPPQAAVRFKKQITKTLECGYLAYVPADYQKTKEKYPLVLFLHGSGERGTDIEKVKKHGPPMLIEKGKQFPFIIVSPQCAPGKSWDSELLINLLDSVMKKYRVDASRVYLTGLSMGGYGAWQFAIDYPERFAAVVPISGGGEPGDVWKLKNIPVWAFHGANDDVVPLKEDANMVDALKDCGGNVKFTVYPELGHNAWATTYNNPEVYDWLLKQHKPAAVSLGSDDGKLEKLDIKKITSFTLGKDIRFKRVPNTVVWISDIEHVIEKTTGEVFLADGEKPFYMYGDVIKANTDFELFPYHYYGADEEKKLGKKINYNLVCQNVTSETVKLDIYGYGTTTWWDHGVPWEAALKGKGKKTMTLAPGEIKSLWEAKQLNGDAPWSAIILGKASGDIKVYDYCYLGEKDPGVANAQPMPDLAIDPYQLASFTRGLSDWNAADIRFFPAEGETVKLSNLPAMTRTFSFAYSPGGPIKKLCEYKAMERSFAEDVMMIPDPVSGKSHPFFGGNYPAMYRFSLPLENDTKKSRTVTFYLCSNDIYNVDTLSGVSIEDNLGVPSIPKEAGPCSQEKPILERSVGYFETRREIPAEIYRRSPRQSLGRDDWRAGCEVVKTHPRLIY